MNVINILVFVFFELFSLQVYSQPNTEDAFKEIKIAVITDNKEQIPWEQYSPQGVDLCLAGGCDNSSFIRNDTPVINNPPITHQPTIPILPSNVQIEMVALPTGIKMSKYEVTQGQWRSVMGINPSYFPQCGDSCPVEEVSWQDIQKFIRHLNKQTGQHFRLPTEDEWYAACQAEENLSTDYCGSATIAKAA